MGFKLSTPLLPYGEALKSQRRRMHNCVGTRAAIKRFEQLEEIETHRFLLRLLDNPDGYAQHIRTSASSLT